MNMPYLLNRWLSKKTFWQINTAFGLMFSAAYLLNSTAPHFLMYQLQRTLGSIAGPLGLDSGYDVLNLIFMVVGLVLLIVIRNSNLDEKLKINSLTIYAFLLSNAIFLLLLAFTVVIDDLNWLTTSIIPQVMRIVLFSLLKTCIGIGAASLFVTLIWHYVVKPNQKLQSQASALLQPQSSGVEAEQSSKVGKLIAIGLVIVCLLIFMTLVKKEISDSILKEQTLFSIEQDSAVNTSKFNIVNWHQAVDITKPALTAEQNKKWTLAVSEWTKLLNVYPNNVEVLLHRADAYEQLGLYENARLDARGATLLGGEDTRVWTTYCWNTLLAKNFKDAIGVCEQAQKINPWDFSASLNLGHAYLFNNDLKQANVWYEKAIKQITNEDDLRAITEDFQLFKRLELITTPIDKLLTELKIKTHAWLDTLAPSNALLKQAEDFESAGKYDEAISLYQQHIAALKNLMGHDSSQIVPNLSSLAIFQTNMGLYQAAEANFKLLQKLVAQDLGMQHVKMSDVLNNYGFMLSSAGRNDEAIKAYQEAIEITKLKEGANHPNMATLLNGLGSAYRKSGQLVEAQKSLNQAVDISLNQLIPDYQMMAKRVNNLGLFYDEVGNYFTANNYFTQALRMTEMSVGPNHIDVCQRLHNLGNVMVKMHHYEEAEKFFRRALNVADGKANPDSKIKTNAILDLAGVLKLTGKNEEAKALYNSVKIFEQS